MGYVDLGLLIPTQVDAMVDHVKDTKGLIFDMRGYPNGTAWAISPRLNVWGSKTLAIGYSRTICGADTGNADVRTASFNLKMPPTPSKPMYRGKVVMLINRITLSQAEHTGIAFEAACGLTFIGSPTAGSNGDVTDLYLPGGIGVTFTGLGIKHADGRQLQRVGIHPDIPVAPTVKGLREGKDEVLDRALAFLRTGK
jgi:C-terminal processing protease CtpA/Prc